MIYYDNLKGAQGNLCNLLYGKDDYPVEHIRTALVAIQLAIDAVQERQRCRISDNEQRRINNVS